MKKTLKYLIFGTLPFIFILSLIFFFNIIKSDWTYAHKSMFTYQNPYNWLAYKTKASIVKSFINFRDISISGLNEKRIYLEEKRQNQLLLDTPKSTKVWQRGLHIDQNNNLSDIQVRLRGDNPRNWLLEKKHWRIKVRKNEIFNQQRYFDYIPFKFDKYFSGKIANKMKMLSPEYKLVELYLNDKSQGVYIESENFNESFLRRKNIMPVNLYKTEQILDESIVGLESNMFNNPGVTNKVAVFNQLPENDKSDLVFFLELMRLSEDNNKYFNNLINLIGIKNWAEFASYQILTQNFHNDNTHNIRFVVDPWSGYLIPIPHDPLIGNLDKENFNFNYSSNDLIALLNQSSEFQHLKLNKLYEVLDSKIIHNLINKHKSIEQKIMTSEKRDVETLTKNFNILNLLRIIFYDNYVDEFDSNERLVFLRNYEYYLNDLKKYLQSKPQGSWKKTEKGFEVAVSNNLPLSNLKLYFKEKKPEWVHIDLNGNNKKDKDEKKFEFNSFDDHYLIPYNFYSNKLDYRNTTSYSSHVNLSTLNTRFNFITSDKSKPFKIEFEHPFTNQIYLLDQKNLNSFPSSKLNKPVKNISKKTSLYKLSGTYEVNETEVFNQDVLIEPGTIFNIHENKSIIFKGKVIAEGNEDFPIIFQRATKKSWGTIAFQGNQTQGSILKNIIFDGGTGFNKENIENNTETYYAIGNIRYISSLSLHNTNNIQLKNILIKNNSIYDDALHIIYCNNINIENLRVIDAFGDAVDIDMSNNITLKNLEIIDSKNDAIDLMESTVNLLNSKLKGSNDKGISVGENSFLIGENIHLINNDIAIATKDGSVSNLNNINFENNNKHVSNYKKNWRYGDGGLTVINQSKFNSLKRDNINFKSLDKAFKTDKYSSLFIKNSFFDKKLLEQFFLSKINKLNHQNKIKKLR